MNEVAAPLSARPRSRTYHLATSGLVAALLCASAWIAIPVGAVPVTLQVFVVLLAALLLPPAWAGAALGAYLLLGAIGAPVFSAGQGGLGVLAGPTGGYLIGFLVAAVAGSLVRSVALRVLPSRAAPMADVSAAVVAILAIYVIGTWRLAAVTGMGPAAAATVGVLPFIGFDAIKAAAAIIAATAIRKARVAA